MWPLLFVMGIVLLFSMNADPNLKILVYSDLVKEIDKATIKKIAIYSNGAVVGEFKTPQNSKKPF